MHGIARAVARLLVMALVMAGVLVAAIFMGVATTTAIAVGMVLAGITGLAMVARRPGRSRAATDLTAAAAPPAPAAPAVSPVEATSVEAMARPANAPIDPEANMPRWRRPSLLEARHSDPTRNAPSYRLPMRFTDAQIGEYDVRVVRYAVVPVLDQPDEILGARLGDLAAGDEVQVLGAHGGFLEVFCPDGQRGWIHRTTLSQVAAPAAHEIPGLTPQEHEDALNALLGARGLT
jgi:hypothetical protein